MFSVAGYPTWEDPLPSQKKHLWSVTFKNEKLFKIDRLRKEKQILL